MQGLRVLFVASAILYTCDGAFVDTLSKCSIKDSDCMVNLYKSVIKGVGKTGVPELNIPPLDPLKVNGLSLEVMDGVTLTIDKGTIEGLSNCQIKIFNLDVDKKMGKETVICDLDIDGHVEVTGSNPALEAFTGSSTVTGEGKGKVRAEQVNVQSEFPFLLVKKDDGKTYVKVPLEDVKYKYDIGNVIFDAEKVTIGKEDVTKTLVEFASKNWKMLLKSFGPAAVEKAMGYSSEFINNIFDKVPADSFFTDDLTPYL